MRQCMDADNLHRRLKKIEGQSVGRWCWKGILSIVSEMGLSMEMQRQPLRILQKQWKDSQTCHKIGFKGQIFIICMYVEVIFCECLFQKR